MEITQSRQQTENQMKKKKRKQYKRSVGKGVPIAAQW